MAKRTMISVKKEDTAVFQAARETAAKAEISFSEYLARLVRRDMEKTVSTENNQ